MGTRVDGAGAGRSAGTPSRDPRFARRATLEERLSRANALIEVLDARAPVATHSEAFRTGRFLQKPRVVALTHADLADPDVTRDWVRFLGGGAVAVDAVHGAGIHTLLQKLGALEVRGEIRAMVVGLPNLGKSSLVNRVTGRARAHTGNRPGITVGEQWIEARPGLRLLDEPGLLPFRPGPVVDALGSVPEGRSDVPAILTCLLSVPILRQRLCAWVGWTDGGGPEVPEVPLEPDTPGAPDALPADAGRDPGPRGSWEPDGERLLRAVAHRIGALGPKGRPDLERASRHVIGLFRDGGLGRISLERPDDPAGGADRSMTLRDGLA